MTPKTRIQTLESDGSAMDVPHMSPVWNRSARPLTKLEFCDFHRRAVVRSDTLNRSSFAPTWCPVAAREPTSSEASPAEAGNCVPGTCNASAGRAAAFLQGRPASGVKVRCKVCHPDPRLKAPLFLNCDRFGRPDSKLAGVRTCMTSAGKWSLEVGKSRNLGRK